MAVFTFSEQTDLIMFYREARNGFYLNNIKQNKNLWILFLFIIIAVQL